MSAGMRGLLFVPGNTPRMMLNCGVFGADGVILDLEDAVPETEKDAARKLTAGALTALDFGGALKIVRVNALATPHFAADIAAVAGTDIDWILLPKVSAPDDIRAAAEALEQEEQKTQRRAPVGILALIETALGVENAFSVACCGGRLRGLCLGAEDLTADLGARRTKTGEEILYARGRIVNAAAAAGLPACDTPFTDVDDFEGLARDCAVARNLGFAGKLVISPRHTEPVNAAFSPTQQETEQARRVVEAYEQALRDGLGSVSLDGGMIDAPVVARARRVLEAARPAGGAGDA